jgi:GT2 family glycosyltransferase
VAPDHARVRVIAAAGERSPAFARNRGVAAGSAPWLVFLDADVEPCDDLLDRYFDPPPGERTGVLAGSVQPAPARPDDPPALRYAHARGLLDHALTLERGRWSFAQTANCAVRRNAFDAGGGFREGVRAGEDADLCWRLAAAGWELEPRERAAVLHHPRRDLRALTVQLLCHGAAASWLDRTWPGSLPPRPRLRLAGHALRRAAQGMIALARGDREEALLGLVDPLALWAFELGRLRSNRARPTGRARERRALYRQRG